MRLLVGFDGSEGARDALELARVLLAATEGAATVVSVLRAGPLPMEYALLEDEDSEAGPLFAEAREALGDVEVETRAFGGGSPAAILTTLADEEGFDAIIVGSPHRGPLGRALLGSVAMSLLNGSPCDVTVAPKGYAQERHDPYRTIVVGYDGSPESKLALARAEELARHTNAVLEIITVVTPIVALPAGVGYAPPAPSEPDKLLNEAVHGVDPKLGARGRRLDGSPASELARGCDEAGADLLVLGSRGYGPLARVLLGSVSRRLIAEAPCPVLVVPRP